MTKRQRMTREGRQSQKKMVKLTEKNPNTTFLPLFQDPRDVEQEQEADREDAVGGF